MGALVTNETFEKKRREKKQAQQRIDAHFIREEMRRNSGTTVFGGSHVTTGGRMPRSVREVKRFLGTLSAGEQKKIERLVEDITLDARVHDRTFTCLLRQSISSF